MLRSEVAVDLAHDRVGEDLVESWTRLDAHADGDGDRGGRWELGLAADCRVLAAAPDEGDVERTCWLRPGESGWWGRAGPVDLRAGLWAERWGKLDLVGPLDVLAGRDRRAGLLVPADHLRLPTPTLGATVGGRPASLDLVLLPLGAADALDPWGTDHALLRQGMVEAMVADLAGFPGGVVEEAAAGALAGDLAAALADLEPALRQGLGGAILAGTRPEPGPDSADLAARLRLAGTGWDGSLVAGRLRSRTPLITLAPALSDALERATLPTVDELGTVIAEGPVRVDWPRTWVIGGDLATTLGPVGLRAEAVRGDALPVPRAWMRGTTRPWTAAGIAVDHAAGTWLLVDLEASWRHVDDLPDDAILVTRDDLLLALGARASALRGILAVELVATWDPVFTEGAGRAVLAWHPRDAWTLEAGCVVLGGDRPPPADWREALTWDGGPLAWWGDDDAAFVALSWLR